MLNRKRTDEPKAKTNGFRVFAHASRRRGLKAKIDLWLKEITPTEDLRNRSFREAIDFLKAEGK